MAIAVLVLWAVTATAGLRLLFTSGLGKMQSAEDIQAEVPEPVAAGALPAEHAEATRAQRAEALAVERVERVERVEASLSKKEARRAERARYDTAELKQSRQQSVGGLRDVVEFMHPACAIIGLAFWLGYSLVHNRALAWIAFGLAAVTACAGLAWFLSNRRRGLFSARLLAIHGGGAAVTFVLAGLTALTARG
jgi:hypothetical protein